MRVEKKSHAEVSERFSLSRSTIRNIEKDYKEQMLDEKQRFSKHASKVMHSKAIQK